LSHDFAPLAGANPPAIYFVLCLGAAGRIGPPPA
jgi:hypothetical protein